MYKTHQPFRHDLESVGIGFDKWRERTLKQGRIPKRLWKAAVSLCDRYSVDQICTRLGIRSTRYRSELSTIANNYAFTPSLDKPEFVVIHNPTSTFELECMRSDGKKLVCRYPSLDALHQTLAWFVEE